ncbi:MAG: histidinol-phosphatase [Desulfobacterales bacterium]|jgi:histidinol-phosphatase (PHP family)
MGSVQRVSVHGGHSGEFCCHAADSLEEIVVAYLERGFDWVGITEHMPPVDDRFRYPEEIEAGLNARQLYGRFERYVDTCRRLQQKYAKTLQLYVGFETEACSGSISFIHDLVRLFTPDYIVGSVHHVDDIGFDYSAAFYARAVAATGGLETFYCRYFDAQHQFLAAVRPQVVGHFDLIRIFDPSYQETFALPSVQYRVRRNLELVRDLDMIMDVNVRAITKGAAEAYPTRSILRQAIELGIPVVPGDDSHGVDTVGLHIDRAVEVMRELGADLKWRRPARS